MPTRSPAAAYQDRAVQTANSPQLLMMLYDRLAVDIERAEVAIELGDFGATNEHLQHAQRIVRMLRSALDPDGFRGGQELLSVYVFLEQHLVKANMEKSVAVAHECAELVRPLHEAWRKAVSANERDDAHLA